MVRLWCVLLAYFSLADRELLTSGSHQAWVCLVKLKPALQNVFKEGVGRLLLHIGPGLDSIFPLNK